MDARHEKYGYARVSTGDQTIDLQKDALIKAGCKEIFIEVASGKTAERKVLKKCLRTLKKGDTLVVWRLDRLGRSVRDLVNIVNKLEASEINFESITEQIDTHTHTGRLIFHIFAALAEFERNLISERTFAGLEAARLRGRIGGRKPKLNELQVQALLNDIKLSGTPVAQLALKYQVSKKTIYNILNKSKAAEST
ncbi:MAG: recombinase family protein [Neisseriaceae bacterium]|nr:recombinase family protein [Neisseriaceae bacterium]MBP6860743.1 recombinase family protein [Neisseriaceae bacterium]